MGQKLQVDEGTEVEAVVVGDLACVLWVPGVEFAGVVAHPGERDGGGLDLAVDEDVAAESAFVDAGQIGVKGQEGEASDLHL